MLIENNQLLLSLTNFTLIFDFSYQNRFIALTFLLITIIVSLYAISQNKKFEVFIGSAYCIASLICLFSGDFISLIISLEFMTICACIFTFYGENQYNLREAKQYFLTHLFSSGLMLIGISYIIINTGTSQITSLTELINSFNVPAILILSGCLVNVGMIFFNGWIINCYPASSGTGFVYLISFTTKVTVIIILKLFSGLTILKIFGIAMIIYGMVYALFEQNLKRLLCYLTISQLGFLLIVISTGSKESSYLVATFLFIHILYNGLFALYFAAIDELWNIQNYSELKNTILFKTPIVFSSVTAAILIATGILPIASTTTKIAMANIIHDNISYSAIIFLKILNGAILFSLFLEKNFIGKTSRRLKFLANFAFLDLLVITVTTCLLLPQILLITWQDYPVEVLTIQKSDIIKQIWTVLISAILALGLRKVPRVSTKNINFDLIQLLEKLINYGNNKYKQSLGSQEEREKCFNLQTVIDNILDKISVLHNGCTSIFIVVFLLISLLIILLVTK